ncbi:hypothetical protein BZG35_12560 [Brevundimonas sp. LM2]|uniref:DUF2442 domain-containing protein n=1 Tax=Brevundimonas sp. LM2 TaxID=1938605 RepID=UPI00098393B1|nr:DUF2442 domain-containing protein [Brevundimonas sp. LM2]AQR62383.1 hypothetical protein BZG35_12560 [Brevundimonas sp. LM2]
MSETLRSLTAVRHLDGHRLALTWGPGEEATVDFAPIVKIPPFRPLADTAVFAEVEVGDWGHSLVWPGEIEIGADSLWLDSLTAWGRDDTRAFLEWRLRNGLSLNGAAEALGLSRRTIAYYSGGRTVPRSILLACKGWDALKAA